MQGPPSGGVTPGEYVINAICSASPESSIARVDAAGLVGQHPSENITDTSLIFARKRPSRCAE
jgi:hypothetical protein